MSRVPLPGILAAALAAAHPAAPPPHRPLVGVADYGSHSQPEQAMSLIHKAGLPLARLSEYWTPGRTTLAPEEAALLKRWAAAAGNTRLLVTLGADKGADAPYTPLARQQFAQYAQDILRQAPNVRDVEVGNEFNRPMFSARRDPTGYEKLLALTYDALHKQRPDANVLGLALAPGGQPLNYMAQVAQAYRASGRKQPLMDTFSHHGYGLQAAGFNKLLNAYTKQFAGTPQRTPSATWPGLWVTEDGINSTPGPGGVSPQQQAQMLTARLAMLARIRQIGAWVNLQLADSPTPTDWHTGLLNSDMTPKPSWGAVTDWLKQH